MSITNLEATQVVQNLLQRANAGEREAWDTLLGRLQQRFEFFVRQQLGGNRLHRWEMTDDVMQDVLIKMYRALQSYKPASLGEYYAFTATTIRRHLIDLARRHFGAEGCGQNLQTRPPECAKNDSTSIDPIAAAEDRFADDPPTLAEWCEFHSHAEQLPDELRQVFDLIYYHEHTQLEVAQLLGLSERTVRDRWRDARLQLVDYLPA